MKTRRGRLGADGFERLGEEVVGALVLDAQVVDDDPQVVVGQEELAQGVGSRRLSASARRKPGSAGLFFGDGAAPFRRARRA